MLVRCFSRASLSDEAPSESIALVAIADPEHARPSTHGWGPAVVMRFYDYELDPQRVRQDGWGRLQDDGFFAPQMAVRLRRFLSCDVVRECDEVWVHCPRGRSRSVAVAKFAAEYMGWRLMHDDMTDVNRTVYALLRDPKALDPRPVPRVQRTWLGALVDAFGGAQRAASGE